MCVKWTGKWRKTRRAITAYKWVTHDPFGGFCSPQDVDTRVPQGRSGKVGTKLVYVPGETVRSRRPGIYLYRKRPPMLDHVLKVRIPAGTWIRLGARTSGRLTINATAVYVVGRA